MQVLGVSALCLAFCMTNTQDQCVNNCWGSVTVAQTTCMEKLRMQSGHGFIGFMGVEEVRQSFSSFNMDTGRGHADSGSTSAARTGGSGC